MQDLGARGALEENEAQRYFAVNSSALGRGGVKKDEASAIKTVPGRDGHHREHSQLHRNDSALCQMGTRFTRVIIRKLRKCLITMLYPLKLT